MSSDDRGRRTDSGIEIRRCYTEQDLEGFDPESAARRAGRFPLHPRGAARHVPRAAVDHAPVRGVRNGRGDERSASSSSSTPARPGLSCAFDLPTQMGYDSDHPRAEGEVGKVGVAIDSLADMRLLLAGLPLDKVTTSMTINATAAILLLLYELVAEEQGVAPEAHQRHHPERHLEGVRRPRHLHLPAPALHAARRPTRSPTAPSTCPDWNTISISGYHIREAGSTAVQEIAFTLANGIAYVEAALAAGMDVDAFAPAALVLLERPQRPVRGGGQVPGGAADLGPHHDRAFRGQGRAVEDVALPHPDRRVDPHGPAAGRQHRPGGPAGPGGRSRRDPEPAHQRLRRGARAADGARRQDRAAHAADRSPSSRASTGTVDPLAGSYFVET